MPDSRRSTNKVKKPRTHSFGGCGTCRRRHVKCDQVRPVCLTCRAVGVLCEGFRTELKWISTSDDKAGSAGLAAAKPAASNTARQHLYSEQSRVSMSTALRTDLASKSVDESLNELEARTKDGPGSMNGNITIGPFTVLDFNQAPTVTEPEMAQPIMNEFDQDLFLNCSNTVESAESFDQLDGFLNWSDLFELDFSPPDAFFQNLDHTSMPVFFGSTLDAHVPSQLNNIHTDSFNHMDTTIANPVIEEERPPEMTLNITVSEAQMLLKHFHDKITTYMFSFPTRQQGPFHTLNLAAAVHTLAELTYLGTQRTTHASFANLLGLLALCALHLGTQGADAASPASASKWSTLGTLMLDRAKEHLHWSLQTETQGPKKAKYKEQLTAVETIIAPTILFDHQTEIRYYMAEAERLLRLRGLAKRTVSRRCRLLHHLYTWLRIVGDTTYVLQRSSKSDKISAGLGLSHLVPKSQQESKLAGSFLGNPPGHNARLDEFLRVEPSTPEGDRDGSAHRDTNEEMEYGDIREWSEGVYLQLYGVSENWLSLVSQTTRLANVIDSVTTGTSKRRKTPAFTESLEKRKERLENMICSFEAANRTETGNKNGPQPTHDQHMVRALNSALVIFFYRRIRNVNPWILQEHVNNVMQALQDFEIALHAHDLEGPGCVWPAFMAGCEAMTKQQRSFFEEWIDRVTVQTGFPRNRTIKSVMVEVWQRRDQAQLTNPKANQKKDWTWMSVSREKNVYVILS